MKITIECDCGNKAVAEFKPTKDREYYRFESFTVRGWDYGCPCEITCLKCNKDYSVG